MADWSQLVSIKGPQGEQGPQGPQGPEGPQGDTGPAGEDGAGIEIAGSVATYATLPTTLGPADAGKGYLVEADGLLYIWTGTAFPADGSGVEFRGPQGIQGPKGDQGIEGPQGPEGVQGPQGETGAQGNTGVGFDGASLGGASGYDLILSRDQGQPDINVGNVRGAQGPQGPDGAQGTTGNTGPRGATWFTGSGVPGTIPGSAVGDLYLNTDTGTVYKLV